jgi:tetratricopeptide (TPR) repeat protein
MNQTHIKIKKIVGVIIFFILIFGIIWYFFFSENNANVLNIDESMRKYAQERIIDLKNKLALDPQNMELKRELSRSLYLIEEFDDAEKTIQEIINSKAASSEIQNPQWYVDLGRIHEAKKEFDSAEEVYKKAIELNTKEFKNPASINIPLVIIGGSTTTISKILPPIVFNLPTPYVALGEFYLNSLDQPEKAISTFLKGKEILPSYPDFYKLLSDSYMRVGDEENAKKYEEEFIRLNTSSSSMINLEK